MNTVAAAGLISNTASSSSLQAVTREQEFEIMQESKVEELIKKYRKIIPKPDLLFFFSEKYERKTDWSEIQFKNPDFTDLDISRFKLKNCVLREGVFLGTKLYKTKLDSADITKAQHLTVEQLASAKFKALICEESKELIELIEKATKLKHIFKQAKKSVVEVIRKVQFPFDFSSLNEDELLMLQSLMSKPEILRHIQCVLGENNGNESKNGYTP